MTTETSAPGSILAQPEPAARTTCPAWCADCDGGRHYGAPVEVAIASCSVVLGLEQDADGTILALSADDSRRHIWLRIQPGEARALAETVLRLLAADAPTARCAASGLPR
jgi:hypothetical protein